MHLYIYIYICIHTYILVCLFMYMGVILNSFSQKQPLPPGVRVASALFRARGKTQQTRTLQHNSGTETSLK